MEEDRKTETSSGFTSSKGEKDAMLNIGEWVDCVVEQIMPYGAFVRMTESGRKGMIHISELSFNFVKKVEDVLSLQQNIRAKIIKIDDKGRIDLSLKKNEERQPVFHAFHNSQHNSQNPQFQGRDVRDAKDTREDRDSFEKKMASFLKVSESKIADLNSKSAPRSGRKRGGGRQGKN